MRTLRCLGVRLAAAERVIGALVAAGCRTFSVLDVRGIAHGLEAGDLDFSVALAQRVEHVVKIEIVARDDDAARWAHLIMQAAYTGHRGDGLVTVLPVESALRISTGDEGERALEDV
jgi:nitrogen regulatory protein P-II 1